MERMPEMIGAWSPQRWRWSLFCLALGLRLLYLAQGFEVPPQDTPDYDEIARNLLAGEGFVARANWYGFELRSWRPPFYPFFLALVYGSWGYSHAAVRGVQALVGAGTVVLVYELGRRLCPGAAALAGLLAAVYGPLVASAGEVMSETWFIFWVVLAAWLLRPGGPARACGALGGAAIALAALTRPVGLLLWPAFALAALIRDRRRGLRRALWALAALLLLLAPWTLRNYQVHGAWVPISTQGGFIVARSNAAAPAWRRERGWGIEREVFERTPSELERDRRWWRQGVEFALDHPQAYARLALERFVRLWYFLRPGYNFWFVLVMPFAVVGLWRFWHRGEFLFLSLFIGLSTAVFCLVLYASTRFRLPLEPFFILFAAAYVHRGLERRGRRMLGVLGAALLANLALWWKDEALRVWVLEWLYRWHLK